MVVDRVPLAKELAANKTVRTAFLNLRTFFFQVLFQVIPPNPFAAILSTRDKAPSAFFIMFTEIAKYDPGRTALAAHNTKWTFQVMLLQISLAGREAAQVIHARRLLFKTIHLAVLTQLGKFASPIAFAAVLTSNN